MRVEAGALANAVVEPIELATERLRMRRWREADREPFAAMNADPAVMEYFPALGTREQSDAIIDGWTSQFAERGWSNWAVEIEASGELIGFVGLSVPRRVLPFCPCVEIGWRLAKAHWGKGYATEAARAALAAGFERVGLEEIVSFTAVGNRRSRAVMERIGMYNANEDFEHPGVPEGHPLRLHCLYRLDRERWLRNRACMQSAAESIATYIRAKDGNQPNLMRHAFAPDATLEMVVNAGSISFPPLTQGLDSITEVLVTGFGKLYGNVHTFCLAAPPGPRDAAFSCNWLVGMSETQTGAVRVGCGRYDWSFRSGPPRLVERLKITVELMQVLPAQTLAPVMEWLSRLPYPWCGTRAALDGAPELDELRPIVGYLQSFGPSAMKSGAK